MATDAAVKLSHNYLFRMLIIWTGAYFLLHITWLVYLTSSLFVSLSLLSPLSPPLSQILQSTCCHVSYKLRLSLPAFCYRLPPFFCLFQDLFDLFAVHGIFNILLMRGRRTSLLVIHVSHPENNVGSL